MVRVNFTVFFVQETESKSFINTLNRHHHHHHVLCICKLIWKLFLESCKLHHHLCHHQHFSCFSTVSSHDKLPPEGAGKWNCARKFCVHAPFNLSFFCSFIHSVFFPFESNLNGLYSGIEIATKFLPWMSSMSGLCMCVYAKALLLLKKNVPITLQF